ncbi:hypothetical protein [uncultured Schumannella sp.]|uniref:hypothetical protein n=1 Tax=uncultured Schumannella sp. TaxID=1195956 RepID=UPI0025ED2738|nr:hypothetical protein [uncultured Schumannella sp.]
MTNSVEPLSAAESAAIGAASANVVEDHFFTVSRRYSDTGSWIPASSPFGGENTFHRLRTFDFAKMNARTTESLAEFLSASVLLHCADAWAYFGRSLAALSHGSLSVAQHLLYYSELRSAMAILARNGIYCIDRTNFVLDAGKNVHRLKADGTHVAVWRYFDAWSRGSAAISPIAGSVKLLGSALPDWLDARHGLASAALMVPQLLSAWGADLRFYARDQKWRNYNSYVPQHASAAAQHHTPSWLTSAVSEVWKLVWSSGGETFSELDAWLTRGAVQQAFREATDEEPAYSLKYARVLDTALPSLVDAAFQTRARTVLRNPLGDSPEILRLAEARPHARIPSSVATKGMIGRALILARLATANTQSLATASGVSPDAFEPWGLDLFLRSGIGVPERSRSGLLDTQSDIILELEMLQDSEPDKTLEGLANVSSSWSHSYMLLTKVERALVWSMVA